MRPKITNVKHDTMTNIGRLKLTVYYTQLESLLHFILERLAVTIKLAYRSFEDYGLCSFLSSQLINRFSRATHVDITVPAPVNLDGYVSTNIKFYWSAFHLKFINFDKMNAYAFMAN